MLSNRSSIWGRILGGAKPKLLVAHDCAFRIAKFPERGDPVRSLVADSWHSRLIEAGAAKESVSKLETAFTMATAVLSHEYRIDEAEKHRKAPKTTLDEIPRNLRPLAAGRDQGERGMQRVRRGRLSFIALPRTEAVLDLGGRS